MFRYFYVISNSILQGYITVIFYCLILGKLTALQITFILVQTFMCVSQDIERRLIE